MESSERNRNSHGSTRLRLSLYAIIFALILVAPIVEMKTGIPLGRDRSTARFHDALSWDEVWAQLPGTLLLYLVIAAPIFALIEWSIRRKMKGYSSVLDSESERDDSPAKPFTGLWRIATIAYFGVAVLLFTCIGGAAGTGDLCHWLLLPRYPSLSAYWPYMRASFSVCRHDSFYWHCPVPGRHWRHRDMSAGASMTGNHYG